MKTMLMNMQGLLFTEETARHFYGIRYTTAMLVEVVVNSEGVVQQELL